MTPSQQFADWQILRTIKLQAVATWILRDAIRRLEKLEREILSALLDSEVSGEVMTKQRQRFNQLKSDLDKLITDAYKELRRRIEDDFATIAAKEDEEQRKLFLTLFGVTVTAAVIDAAQVDIMGSNLKGWLGKQAGDLQFRIEKNIQTGLLAGEDESKLRRRVKGWPGQGKEAEAVAIPRPIIPSQKALEQILRTGVEAVGQEVTIELGEQIPKSIRMGWQQLSVLDARTTNICRAYAFKIWNRDYEPLGHKLPFNGGVPRHLNCRSRIVPYIFEDGPSAELTFKQWLAKLGDEEQKRILGAERLKLYKKGILSEQDLIRSQEIAIAPENLND